MSQLPPLQIPPRVPPETEDVQALKDRVLELEELAFRRGRGLHILHRHLRTGGTDHAILIGIVENTLTGTSPASVAETRAAAQ
ncbi:hypothetical protein [Arthrobacter caoxuetaonis]|uniref:Uncharacterized protein n=1 Tax=Arthrobacter caoxuetaonis TaxID=2886935 RepID=A0A9X1SEE6_9MICC|nr:hypothetical protein [Arthrobacter caoxuetaonis]MCC3299772.1 hypothetical protein [Arthrobacter caoxuetaonis]USQ59327.1 hypothetical protein NF551_17235 [Arthrobacter caoxuetaonis]